MLEDATGIEVIPDPPPEAPAPPPERSRGAFRTSRHRVDEAEAAILRTKSFTTPAVIVLILYFVLWIPGFIANLVYLAEASKVKSRTGRTPDGWGCLWGLLLWWVGGAVLIVILVAGGCLGCAAIGAGGTAAMVEQRKKEQAAAAAQPVSEITWADLQKTYGSQSTATAMQKSSAWDAYKDKKVKWTGKALRVSGSRGTTTLLIGMTPETTAPEVEVHLNMDQLAKALKVKEGDNVTLLGILDKWSSFGPPIVLKYGEIVEP